MRLLASLALVLAAVALAGCSWFRHEPASASAASATKAGAADQKFIVTPSEGLGGKVVMVNANLRFVVLNFPVGQSPAIDQLLTVYRNGTKVGELKVTGPQRNENTVADIVAGEAAKGDEVRDK